MTRRGRLSIKCNTFFPENFKRRFPVETFPRTVIQKRLNRGNVGFRNRSEVEALRVKEANHIVREALNKLARAGSERFFVRQKNGKQGNTVCISCFSFCMAGEKDPLSSRRRFVQRFLSILVCSPLPRFMGLSKVDKSMQKPCPADFRKRGTETCGQAGRSQNPQEKVPFIRADWSGMLRRLPALLPVFPGLPEEPFWGRPR